MTKIIIPNQLRIETNLDYANYYDKTYLYENKTNERQRPQIGVYLTKSNLLELQNYRYEFIEKYVKVFNHCSFNTDINLPLLRFDILKVGYRADAGVQLYRPTLTLKFDSNSTVNSKLVGITPCLKDIFSDDCSFNYKVQDDSVKVYTKEEKARVIKETLARKKLARKNFYNRIHERPTKPWKEDSFIDTKKVTLVDCMDFYFGNSSISNTISFLDSLGPLILNSIGIDTETTGDDLVNELAYVIQKK